MKQLRLSLALALIFMLTHSGTAWTASAASAPARPPHAAESRTHATPTPTFPWCRNWYPDCDGDSDGDPVAPLYSCRNPNWSQTPPACPYVRSGEDCDDANPDIHSGAVEGPALPETTSDGIDNDCDGIVDIDCDGTSSSPAPRVELMTPARGTFASQPSVLVSGVVVPGQDLAEVTRVTVGSTVADLERCSEDGGARFSTTVPLVKGEQTLVVEAIDTSAHSDRALTSVVYSDRYMNLKTAPVSGAAVALVNQGTWNILGDWLEALLDDDALEAELLASNPLVQDSGDYDCIEKWEIYGNATAYTHDDVQVGFTVTGGKIAVTARLIRPQIWASGWAYYDLEWYCGSWSDRVDLSAYGTFSEVTASANGWLSLNSSGQVGVSFTDVVVDAKGQSLDVDADSSIYDWLIDYFEDDLADELEQFVEDELREYVLYDLGPELAAELNSLDLSYTVEVGDIAYGVAFTYDALRVLEGGIALGFKLGLSYTTDARTPANPGAVGLPTTYTANVSPTFAFKFSDDFFNGALHALWEGGSLYVSETLLTEPLTTGTSAPLLPPVVTPGTSPYHLELTLGDVIGDVSVATSSGMPFKFQAALSTRVSVSLIPVVNGTTITFDVRFSPADVAYDVLGNAVIPAELLTASELAMEKLMAQLLLELEGYLESLEISYFDIPVNISALKLGQDPANSAMLSLDGTASYTGP